MKVHSGKRKERRRQKTTEQVLYLSHIPRADFSTEFPEKGGIPLPKESTKELSNVKYSKALANSLQVQSQTFGS